MRDEIRNFILGLAPNHRILLVGIVLWGLVNVWRKILRWKYVGLFAFVLTVLAVAGLYLFVQRVTVEDVRTGHIALWTAIGFGLDVFQAYVLAAGTQFLVPVVLMPLASGSALFSDKKLRWTDSWFAPRTRD